MPGWKKGAVLGVSVLFLVASCATSRGTTLDTVLAAQASAEAIVAIAAPGDPSPKSAEQEGKGLRVSSDPSDAAVWIDGSLRGDTPYYTEDLSPDRHLVTVRKPGYYESSAWVSYAGASTTYRVNLVEIVGFLQLSVAPVADEISVDGMPVGPGLIRLRIGAHDLSVKAFGYREYRQTVSIDENAVSPLSVSLSPAAFDVTSFVVPKTRVNPEMAGLAGSIEIRFSVTGAGSGEITVAAADEKTVYHERLPRFKTWNQVFTWTGADDGGAFLPDGVYTIILEARGEEAGPSRKRKAEISIDRSLKIAVRSLWSGSAGLLYVPAAESLPEGDFQFGVSAAGIGTARSPEFQIPVLMGTRWGLGEGLELDISGALLASSAATSYKFSVALRRVLSTSRGPFGAASAIQAKLSYQYDQDRQAVLLTDTFADFTGLSLEWPVKLILGPAAVSFSAGATGSFWYPYRVESGGAPIFDPVAWLYLRGGVSLESGPLVAGVSASLRTGPLPGLNPYAAPLPFQAGAEAHWLIPRSRFALSAIVAGEFENAANYYFMGGGGLSYLY